MPKIRSRPPSHLPPALNITIGVAGHIDHGKTELVKMLTGCDTDRLKEEKERGLSIEIGYAPCVLEGGCVGIVDVPGHERFVRKMVAGATGIDIALLVVAADDGVMPQTREHFDIVDLLGVRHLFVAVSKIDLVSPERVEEVVREVREFLQPTYFAAASITPLSSVTGDGLDQLRLRMGELVATVERRKTNGVFRLPIDRVFSSPGHGVVVTGVAASGSIQTGNTVDILPAGKTARVRGLQVYLGDAQEGVAGQCVALNLTNIRQEDLARGSVVAAQGRFTPQTSFLVRLKASRFLAKPIQNAMKVQFHTGTFKTPGKIRLLESDALDAGEEAFAHLFTGEPVTAFLRDRFILRLESPACTLAGGTIIDCGTPTVKRHHAPTLERLSQRWETLDSESGFIMTLLGETPFKPHSVNNLALAGGWTDEATRNAVDQLIVQEKIIRLGSNLLLSRSGFESGCQTVLDGLKALHANQPDRYTFSTNEILGCARETEKIIDAVLAKLLSEKRIEIISGAYRLAGTVMVDPRIASLAEKIEAILLAERFQTSAPEQLAEKLRAPVKQIENALNFLTEKESVRRLSEKIYLHDVHVRWARNELVAAIRRDGHFETHQFKNVIHSSRKYAIPLLDYFDSIGLTRRLGGNRYLC